MANMNELIHLTHIYLDEYQKAIKKGSEARLEAHSALQKLHAAEVEMDKLLADEKAKTLPIKLHYEYPGNATPEDK